MSKPRALIVCPGRGSYTRTSLGYLAGRTSAVVDACDAWRQDRATPTVRELDGAKTFQVGTHIAGEHASILTFACSMADVVDLNVDIVGVTGNSMGFYTALAVSGALSTSDAIRLVDTMGSYQHRNVVGGQLMYPLTAPDWTPDAALPSAVDNAIMKARTRGGKAYWSIQLGGFAILGADRAGLALLTEHLPPLQRGARSFPARLPKHSAFHTPIMAETSDRAKAELADLEFRAPRVPLFDGAGRVYRPRWTDIDTLRAYTLGEQVTSMFNYDAAILSALHHCGPDVIVLLGPGNALGGATARILLADGWAGLMSRDQLQREPPLLVSYGVAEQRKHVS